MGMGFKLVRVDATEPCKVYLPVGSHFVGRGKFLDCSDHRVSRKHAELVVTADFVLLKSCSDHRVSRKHAELVVTADFVLLKSLHQNPCFVKKKSSNETIIFSQPDSHKLSNGDQFGLIPDNYWYEVINCLEDSPTHIKEKSILTSETFSKEQNGQVESKNISNENTINEGDTQPYNNDNREMNSCESPSLLPPENPSSPTLSDNEMDAMFAHNFEDFDTASADLPIQSRIQAIESTNQPVEPTIQPVEPTAQPVESLVQPIESTGQPTESAEQGINKRSHTQDTVFYDVKRVKSESDTPTIDSEDGTNTGGCSSSSLDQPVKTEPGSPQDVKPGPSNIQGGSSNNGLDAPQSPVKPPNNPLRERCMYGANCYRKNPQHKATFSHPTDADWGSGSTAPCPWGAACGRRDPRHWRDHTHPPGVGQPPPRPPPYNIPGIQLVRRHGNNFYINANAVHFYDDHFEVEDSDGDSVDYDYEF